MAGSVAAPVPGAQDAVPRVLLLTCFALCVANVVWLGAMYADGQFLLDKLGRVKPVDFVNVWTAGQLVLDGQAAAVYDWTIHRAVENKALGYEFDVYFGWHYPPPYLFIATALALLPYLAAYFLWLAMTLPMFLCTVRWIVGHPSGWVIAAGFPAILTNIIVGQNGFLTASLIGGGLGFMQKRPVLSGICLGLLTYKPQFGLLFPIVLIAARRWTVFWTAAIVGIALALASWAAFGMEAWQAFIDWLPVTSNAVLSEGRANLGRQQSIFAFVRVLGGDETLAWAAQIAAAGTIATALIFLWRSRAAFELKAAALAAGTLLATPYVYLYDVVVLAVAAAFFVRLCIADGFRTYEPATLAAVAVLLSSFPFVRAPVALGATVIMIFLIFLRASHDLARSRPIQ
jgi:arabinofuranan 3-O-arabinosyltransferase